VINNSINNQAILNIKTLFLIQLFISGVCKN